MAIQYINTGTAPNQGNGDTLRTAFNKINNNFADLFTIGHYGIASFMNTSTQAGISVYFNTSTNSMSFIVGTVSTTTSKTLTLASTSTSASDSDGAGIIVNGPTIPATFLYTAADDSWTINKQLNTPEVSNSYNEIRVAGHSTSTGIILDIGMYDDIGAGWLSRARVKDTGSIESTNVVATNAVTGSNLYSTSILYQGDSYDSVQWSSTSLRSDGDVNAYRQMVMKNHNNGNRASSDLVIGGNVGDEYTNYVDIGFNNSGYEDPTYGIYTPNSGYVFTNGGPLFLGTQSPGAKLYFHAGGTQAGNAGGFLDEYAWNFNRSVQVIVGTPAPLNFTVQNTNSSQGATSVYQALNDVGTGIIMGVHSSNTIDGRQMAGDAFIRTVSNTTSTNALHIGNRQAIYFYADVVLGNTGPPILALEHNGLYTQASFDGDVVPATGEYDNYDIGTTTATWRSLYLVGTGGVHIGGVPITMNTSTRQLVVDGVAIGASTATGIAYTPATPSNWLGTPTVATVALGLDELASRVSAIPVRHYGVFSDSTTQIAVANTATQMTFNTTEISNGISIVDGSKITIANTGTYNIQFSAQIDRTANGTDEVSIWLRKNGINVPLTNTDILVTGTQATNPVVAAWNLIQTAAAGDYFELMWSTPNDNVRLQYKPAKTNPDRPETPSVILTVVPA